MCGRFSLFAPQNEIEQRFGATFVDDYQPRYNAAPSQSLPIVPDVSTDEFHDAEWGLIPTWADDRKDGGHINARAESAAEKPSFRDAVRGAGAGDSDKSRSGDEADAEHDEQTWETASAGRCLVPADGFYEWGDTGDGRRPYRLVVGEGECFAMAGLWTRWEPPHRQSGLGEFGNTTAATGERESIHTFAILTTAANATVAPIHDRMPVILGREEEMAWLDAENETELLDPYDGEMRKYAVSQAVNDPRNDSPAVTEPSGG